jgi:hypothetical protein
MMRYVVAWILMVFIAIANGILRQLAFAKTMSETRAHQLSTLTGSVAIGAFIWFTVRTYPPSSNGQALLIGLVWGVSTILFESFMGLVLQRRSVREILHEYNLLAGRVWLLFLVWLVAAPWIFYRLLSL